MEGKTKEKTFSCCRKYEGCAHYHLNEHGIDACTLGFDTWSGQCNNFTKKKQIKKEKISTCYWCKKEYDYSKNEGYQGGGMYYRGMDYICNECLMSKTWQGTAGLENTYKYHINKIEKMKGEKKMSVENVTINSKERVLKIIEKRQKYIQKICDLVKSDKLIRDSDGKLTGSFLGWLKDNRIITTSTSEESTRKPRTRNEKKQVKRTGKDIAVWIEIETDTSRLLRSTHFKNKIYFSTFGSPKVFGGENMIDLNSELWMKAKKIIDIIVPYMPIYIEDYYKKELNRLCPVKENIVCERCGHENDTCNQFCGECGKKL